MKPIFLILYYCVSVILPVVFWYWFFHRLDKKDPEPYKLIGKVFRYGFGALMLSFLAEFFVDRIFFSEAVYFISNPGLEVDSRVMILLALSFFLAGPIEELIKYFALKWAIFKKAEFNQIADGIIYGTMLALGFAFIENTGYFFGAYSSLNSGEFVFVILIRGIMTTMLHVVATGILGLFVARSKFLSPDHHNGAYKGIVIASLLHGMYNLLTFFYLGMIVNAIMIFLAAVYLVKEIKKKEVQEIWKTNQ